MINLRGLNATSSCIGNPFSSSRDINLDIADGTYLFVTADLVNAYFQLRISQESVHLLTFICPIGKFAMLRIPQGWHESGDLLNIETRCLLSSLSHSLQIFDDLLLQS